MSEETRKLFLNFRMTLPQVDMFVEKLKEGHGYRRGMTTEGYLLAILHNQSLILSMLAELTNKEIKKVE